LIGRFELAQEFSEPLQDSTADKEAVIARAVSVMEQGLPWPDNFQMPSRDEMHDRDGPRFA